MRQGQNAKRHRGSRSNGRRHQHGMSSNYDSNGPDVKIKGTASQVQDRYQALARDAVSMDDRVAAENYYQHAEHYQRIINANLAAAAESNAQNAQVRPNGADGQPPADGQAAQPRVDGQPRSETQPAAPPAQPRNEAPESNEPKPNGRGRGRSRRAPEAADSADAKAPVKDAKAEKTASEASGPADGDDTKDSASSANA
ncbi:MAG: DUF4167 domain-containing protein [Alphaproteobacteria bacterium]